jgi:hypothetical protein
VCYPIYKFRAEVKSTRELVVKHKREEAIMAGKEVFCHESLDGIADAASIADAAKSHVWLGML